MTNHETWDLISAYIDGELTPAESAQVQAHLQSCSACRLETEGLRQVKQWNAAAPRRTAPPELIADLEERLSRPSWQERLFDWWHMPQVQWPAAAVALATLTLGLWFGFHGTSRTDTLPLEPLLAAHSRYSAESLAPAGDLVASNFSAQLAMNSSDEE